MVGIEKNDCVMFYFNRQECLKLELYKADFILW